MKKIDIIYEDDDIIVCYKPAGVATQTRRLGQQDMESYLRNYRAAQKESAYVGIVHRLDQPVEGVMVFAKNQKAAASLSRQIKEHTTEKYYYAASCGNGAESTNKVYCEETRVDKPDINTLIDYIVFDRRTNTSSISSSKDSQAKKAVLQYRVINDKETTESTIFDIKLLTGRHHQIRLQLANMGYPLIGDTKYGNNETGKQLALCSYRISIDHPSSGERMTFEIKPKNPEFEIINSR